MYYLNETLPSLPHCFVFSTQKTSLLTHLQYTDVIDSLPPPDRPRAVHVRTKLLAQQKDLQGLVHSKPRVEEQSLNAMDVMKTLASHHNVDEPTAIAIVDGVKGCKSLLRSQ